ncbi:MAG: hypothetical protein ACWA5X_11775 [bacterium]
MDELELYDRRGKNHSVMMPVLAVLFVLVGLVSAWLFWKSQQPAQRTSMSNEEYVRVITKQDKPRVPYGTVQGIVSRSPVVPVEQPSRNAKTEELVQAENQTENQKEMRSAASAGTMSDSLGEVAGKDKVLEDTALNTASPLGAPDSGKSAGSPVASTGDDGKTSPVAQGKVAEKNLGKSLEKAIAKAAEIKGEVKPASEVASVANAVPGKPGKPLVEVHGAETVKAVEPVKRLAAEPQRLTPKEKARVERDYSLFTVDAAFAPKGQKPPSRSEQRCLEAREKLEELKAQMHTDYEASEYRTLINQQIHYNRRVKKYCF